MRFAILTSLFFCCLFSACNNKVKSKGSKPATVDELTPAQRESIRKYNAGRKKVTDFLKLPEKASIEEIRPIVARFLKLPPDASLQELLDVGVVRVFLTEERRKRYAPNLPPPSTPTSL